MPGLGDTTWKFGLTFTCFGIINAIAQAVCYYKDSLHPLVVLTISIGLSGTYVYFGYYTVKMLNRFSREGKDLGVIPVYIYCDTAVLLINW